jgi:hypothetical protein
MIAYFVLQGHTVFMPLKYIYPECSTLIEPFDSLEQLHCLRQDFCPANKGCVDKIVLRLKYLYDNVFTKEVKQVLGYYKTKEGKLKAGLFTVDFDTPRVLTLHPKVFAEMQGKSATFTWRPTTEYSLISPDKNLIPADSLLRIK